MDRTERIQAVAGGYVERQQFSGIEWLVTVRGEQLARGAVGFSDAEAKTAIPDDAIYRIYSMTKPVVSLMALILIEQGKLRLYDLLPSFNPAFRAPRVLHADGRLLPAERPILVEDLLTHRAGFSYEFIHGCQVAPYYRAAGIAENGGRSLDDMMTALAEQPIAFQPGSQFRYSVATDVLAHVIERAADRPIDELLKTHIFDPLGMTNTAYHVPETARGRLMKMYGTGELTGLPALDFEPQELEPADVDAMYPFDQPGAFRRGGHGLFSTLGDYHAFANMLLDGRAPDGTPIVSRKMHELLSTNRIPADQLPLRIGMNALPGYGWGLIGRVMLDRGQALALTGDGEFGWAGAASTYFWVDPREGMTGVVMTQYLGATLPLADDIRSAAYQQLA